MIGAIGLGELLWSLVVLFFMAIYLIMLFSVVVDLFRDRELSGWWKAVWALFLLVLPVVSVIVYLVTRSKGMADRAMAHAHAVETKYNGYVSESVATPTDQIARAKQLLDEGAIDAEEFAALKRKALA